MGHAKATVKEDASFGIVLLPPTILLILMSAVAVVIRELAGLSGLTLIFTYVSTAAGLTFVLLLVWLFIEIAKLAQIRAPEPLRRIAPQIPEKIRVSLIPALIFPLFVAAYTTAKCAIPFMVGYRWDRFWADLDRSILGVDAWQLTWAWFTPGMTLALEVFYTLVWGFALFGAVALAAIYGSRRFLGIFTTALMLTWMFGGWMMAYATSAAGPVFAHLFDPSLANRFDVLRADLAATLDPQGPIARTQAYLAWAAGQHLAVKGGGISAMPSMHLGTSTIIVCALWKSRLRLPALLFWVLTMIGSVHFGYHYALDGLIAAPIAVASWVAAKRIYAVLPQRNPERPIPPAPLPAPV